MASKAYVTPASSTSGYGDASGVLKSNQQMVDTRTGIVKTNWWRFFQSLEGAPQQEAALVLGASPTAFLAPARCQILISGGTGISITYTRKATYSLTATSGFFPMSTGDSITITYSSAPTVTYFPW